MVITYNLPGLVLHHHLLDVSGPALGLVLLDAHLPLARRRVALPLPALVRSSLVVVRMCVRHVGHHVEDHAVVAASPVRR